MLKKKFDQGNTKVYHKDTLDFRILTTDADQAQPLGPNLKPNQVCFIVCGQEDQNATGIRAS